MKLLAVIVVLGMTPSLIGGELPTPADIEEHIRAWHADCVTLRIGYEQSWPGAPDIKKYREFTLTDTKSYYDMEEWHGTKEHPYRDVFGGNAEGRFRAGYRFNTEEEQFELRGVTRMQRKNDNTGYSMGVEPLWPFLFPFGHWLDEYKLTTHLVVEGIDEIHGEECVLVRFEHSMYDGGTNFRAWLATQKDYLAKKAIPLDDSNRGSYYICDDFEHDGSRWYPKKGRSGDERPDYYHTHWEVTKFEVNPAISASLFTPPDDSHIRKQRQAEARRKKEQQQSGQQGEQLPAAIAPSWRNLYWSMALLGATILLTIGCFRMVKSRRI